MSKKTNQFPEIKFLFFGTPEFALIILQKLIIAGFVPSALICNPDRPVGRKKIITPPPTKVLANKLNIPVLQLEKIEVKNLEKEISKKVKNQLFDFFIVAAYSKIIPIEIIKIPRLGVIGVHPSLLPKYRGPSPIQSAILNGEKTTGITLYLLDEKVDHGPILAKREMETCNFSFSDLSKKLAELGGDLLVEILPKFLKKEINPLPQNEVEATYTKKFKTEDGFVDEKLLKEGIEIGGNAAIVIDRKIRALNPEPGVWTILFYKNQTKKRLKLLESEIKNNKLSLKKIQLEGKRPQEPTGEFLKFLLNI